MEVIIPFFIVFFVMFFVLAKVFKTAKDAQNKYPPMSTDNATEQTNSETNGNGRTREQEAYLAELRKRAAQRKLEQDGRPQTVTPPNDTHGDNCPAVADAHSHEHIGTEEHYAPIVGSLGGESTEGCVDLDGVRLISHDAAYSGDEDQVQYDKNKVLQAIVIGEVLDTPRFKYPYGNNKH